MSRRLLIDADGCPVVDASIAIAKRYAVECLILCDTAHRFERPGAQTLTFSKGADSVDFALVNLLHPGDIVVTQDYGLAAMCLARNARILHQDGMEYTDNNIGGLLWPATPRKKSATAAVGSKARQNAPRRRTKHSPHP